MWHEDSDYLDYRDDWYNWEDDILSDSTSVATGSTLSNPADLLHSSMREKSMSAFTSGFVFTTGNEVVNTLPVGSTLEVSGDGELTIVSVPVVEQTYNPGDFFASKYGDATIVGMTSQFGKVKSIVSGEAKGFLYVADGTNIVRGQLL